MTRCECHDSPRRLLTCNSESASQPLGCRSNIPRGKCKGHAFQGRRTPQLRLWEVSTEIPPQEVRPLVVPALVIRTMITGYLRQFAKLGVLPFSEYMEGQNFYCMMGVCAASSGLDDKHIDIKCLKHIKMTVPHVANRTSCAANLFAHSSDSKSSTKTSTQLAGDRFKADTFDTLSTDTYAPNQSLLLQVSD